MTYRTGDSPDIESQEASAWESCYATAIRNGHSLEEAASCDNGSIGCPDCPFGGNPEQEV